MKRVTVDPAGDFGVDDLREPQGILGANVEIALMPAVDLGDPIEHPGGEFCGGELTQAQRLGNVHQVGESKVAAVHRP